MTHIYSFVRDLFDGFTADAWFSLTESGEKEEEGDEEANNERLEKNKEWRRRKEAERRERRKARKVFFLSPETHFCFCFSSSFFFLLPSRMLQHHQGVSHVTSGSQSHPEMAPPTPHFPLPPPLISLSVKQKSNQIETEHWYRYCRPPRDASSVNPTQPNPKIIEK